MTSPDSEIIAYGYESAPNPQKLFQFLAFFGIAYKYVEIPEIMPRPQLAEIGVTYRRSPLLSIASDMYIDTALIISKLSDIAQHFDSGLTDATNHLEYAGLGQQAIVLSVGLLPGSSRMLKDKAFLADRSDLLGPIFNPEAMIKARPLTIGKMLNFLQLIQGHFLKEGRKFMLGGNQPTTADMYLYWALNWGLRYHNGARPEISPDSHPKIFQWLDAVKAFIDKRKSEIKISMEDAIKVLQMPPKHEHSESVLHVDDNPEGLRPGQKVKVTPESSGKSGPQLGELISLNYEQICLRNTRGLVMHFPRIDYQIVRWSEEEANARL